MTVQPINLRELYGDRYRIILDEAATPKDRGPWYYQIPCQFGHFYPHSGQLLGFFCESGGIIAKLHRAHPELEWMECEGEAIFYFAPEQFDMIAKYAKPKKLPGQRQLSLEQRKQLVESGKKYRFKTGVQ